MFIIYTRFLDPSHYQENLYKDKIKQATTLTTTYVKQKNIEVTDILVEPAGYQYKPNDFSMDLVGKILNHIQT